MADFYPLLIYLGFGGGLLLLGMGSFPKTRSVRRPLSAGLAALLVLIWALSPRSGRWVMSVWAPSSVSGGWMLLDMSPAIWQAVLIVGVALCGAMVVSASERNDPLPLTGTLVAVTFTVAWLALASGSLLMTLAMWAVFDVVWLAVRLVGRADGERVVWTAAIGGGASLVLWTVSLFLLQGGTSGLWWLMRPSQPVLTLLTAASLLRIGFYPFQVMHVEAHGRSRALTLLGTLSPLMGAALLYRLLALPGHDPLPGWVLGWGVLSVLWAGIRALSVGARDRLQLAANGVMLAAVTGAVALRSADALMWGIAAWVACESVLLSSRRYSPREPYWFWPTLVALGFLLGAPPSPFHQLYAAIFTVAAWPWRVAFALGLALIVAALLRSIVWRAAGRVRPPMASGLVALVLGLTLGLVVLVASGIVSGAAPPSPVALLLWAAALAGGMALARWGRVVRATWRRAAPVIDLLDVRWLYRAGLQGAENLLGTVRVTAEVVEGSGSVLWSVLVLLLVLMVIGNR